MVDIRADTILDDEDFDTILSAEIDFSGTLNFEKPLLIRGRVSGEILAQGILAQGILVVDEQAVVEANINAPRVIVKGSVKGNITASDRVEVAVTGKLVGNVTAPEIFMETGCAFNGRCTMIDRRVSS